MEELHGGRRAQDLLPVRLAGRAISPVAERGTDALAARSQEPQQLVDERSRAGRQRCGLAAAGVEELEQDAVDPGAERVEESLGRP